MTAVFVLCVRNSSRGHEVLLGEKQDGKILERGLTVPAGGSKKSDADLRNTAIRELYEEAGILLTADQLSPFRINGGDYWFLARLTDEIPRDEPEMNPDNGKPVWGPARFYEVNNLPTNIARWHRTRLKKAIRCALQ